jgi:hypothetical protein
MHHSNTHYVGLDVHKDTIAVAYAPEERATVVSQSSASAQASDSPHWSYSIDSVHRWSYAGPNQEHGHLSRDNGR